MDINITEDDLELGKRLVSEGWKSVSNKYRTVKRFKNRIHEESVLNIEMISTEVYKRALQILNRELYSGYYLRMDAKDAYTESLTLTIEQFKAFKMSGGTFA